VARVLRVLPHPHGFLYNSFMRRRDLLLAAAAAPAIVRGAAMTRKERIDRALAGSDVDRTPFTFWHHFGLKTPEEHAARTLEFHRDYRTDLVKVMSDFPYPKGKGKTWYDLKVVENPFPQQIRALELIRDGLNGDAYFVETIFNSWNVAEKLSSKEEVRKLKTENPQALMNALDVITESQVKHIRRALKTGAAGILLSVANANAAELDREDYIRYSRPFDRRLMQAAAGSKLAILHLHLDKDFIELFDDTPATVINYSAHVSHVPIREMRRRYSQAIMGGIDEVNYRTLNERELKAQWDAAQGAAGKKFILVPGCSVPNESTAEELKRLPAVVGA
jgi:uroporphyrinogen-III decarboxylase